MGKYFQTKYYFFLIFLNSFLENFESLNFNYTKMFNPKLQGGCVYKIIEGRDVAPCILLQKAFFDWADISVARHFSGPTFRWSDISAFFDWASTPEVQPIAKSISARQVPQNLKFLAFFNKKI